MSHRNGELDMSHPFPADLLFSHFNTTSVADDATIADSLVFSAMAFIVLSRTENLLTEQTILLRLVSSIVDGFRLQDLSGRPCFDIFRRCECDADSFEIAFNLVFFIKSRHISKISIVCY